VKWENERTIREKKCRFSQQRKTKKEKKKERKRENEREEEKD